MILNFRARKFSLASFSSFVRYTRTTCSKVDGDNRLDIGLFQQVDIVTRCYELLVIKLLTTCYVQTTSDLLEKNL